MYRFYQHHQKISIVFCLAKSYSNSCIDLDLDSDKLILEKTTDVQNIIYVLGTVIGVTQPPPKDGARNALFSNRSKSGLDKYVAKRSKRHLLEEVS